MEEHQMSVANTQHTSSPIDADMLLRLLVALRGSGLATTDRERLRGVILDYSRVLNQEAVRDEHTTTLRKALAPYAAELAPVVGELFPELARTRTDVPERSIAPQRQEPDTSLWHTRPTPTFQQSAAKNISAAAPMSRTPGNTTDRPQSVSSAGTAAAGKSAASVSPPEPTPTQPTHDQPEITHAVEPEPAAPQAPTESPSAHVSAPAHTPRERIREIKRAVNEMVGNPLSLLDHDEAVGRAYMDALLAATKRTLSGQDPHQELAALEDAYKRVQTMLASGQSDADKEQDSVSAAVHGDEGITDHNLPHTQLHAQSSTKRAAADSAASENTSSAKDTAENNTSTPHDERREPVSAAASQEANSTKPQLAQAAQGNKIPIRQGRSEAAATVTASADGTSRQASTTTPAHDAHTPAGQRWVSSPVAAGAAANDASHSEKAAPAQEKPDVEGALRQLLSEWQIFKKSGFLGMGPGGIDHPLFQTLRNLPMSAVVGGRFEGATPEVRQNIADYMNGWRYEHDIVHRLDETFEQYLRRVVAHILTHHGVKEEGVQKNTH